MKRLIVAMSVLVITFAFAGCRQRETPKTYEKSSRPVARTAPLPAAPAPEEPAPAATATDKSGIVGTWEYSIRKESPMHISNTVGSVAFKENGTVSDEAVTEVHSPAASGKDDEITLEERADGRWELKNNKLYEIIESPKFRLTKYVVDGKDRIKLSDAELFTKMLVSANTGLRNVFQITSFSPGRIETILVEKEKKTTVVFIKKQP